MMAGINWGAVSAIAGLVVMLAGFVVWLLRARFAGDFASRADVAGLRQSVDSIERRLGDTPTHEDVRGLVQRLTAVEAASGIVSAEVRAVREGVSRVERDLHLLIQHELGKQGDRKA
jgi:hypothetical protein